RQRKSSGGSSNVAPQKPSAAGGGAENGHASNGSAAKAAESSAASPADVDEGLEQESQPRRRHRATAQSMAAAQRDISVSEFFAKNRHLLGFDNPRKALLTAVKEAVDNSLDACEEAGILPELWVHIEPP